MLEKFIIDGVVGPIRIGLNKSELIALLGPPQGWEGRPGTRGREIPDFQGSSTWNYNGIHLHFEDDSVKDLVIWPDYVQNYNLPNWSHEWFFDWPLSKNPKLIDLMDFFDIHYIPYLLTPTLNGWGHDLVLSRAYVLGVAKRKLSEVDVFCVCRVDDDNRIPSNLLKQVSVIPKIR